MIKDVIGDRERRETRVVAGLHGQGIRWKTCRFPLGMPRRAALIYGWQARNLTRPLGDNVIRRASWRAIFSCLLTDSRIHSIENNVLYQWMRTGRPMAGG